MHRTMRENGNVAVLFVCMGNICRSPAAHGVMESMVAARGLSDRVRIESAGTLDYHEGELPDGRMRDAAFRRGYVLDHRSRPVTSRDFHAFDYVVAMDFQNLHDLAEFTPRDGGRAKVSLLMSHCESAPKAEVPDPYLGGSSAFEHVLDLVEQGCAALLDEIQRAHALR
jgi:protein-tyrosine phosphatase